MPPMQIIPTFIELKFRQPGFGVIFNGVSSCPATHGGDWYYGEMIMTSGPGKLTQCPINQPVGPAAASQAAPRGAVAVALRS